MVLAQPLVGSLRDAGISPCNVLLFISVCRHPSILKPNACIYQWDCRRPGTSRSRHPAYRIQVMSSFCAPSTSLAPTLHVGSGESWGVPSSSVDWYKDSNLLLGVWLQTYFFLLEDDLRCTQHQHYTILRNRVRWSDNCAAENPVTPLTAEWQCHSACVHPRGMPFCRCASMSIIPSYSRTGTEVVRFDDGLFELRTSVSYLGLQ